MVGLLGWAELFGKWHVTDYKQSEVRKQQWCVGGVALVFCMLAVKGLF